MIFGKYGNMILKNMEKNYPIRKNELELTGKLEIMIFEREKYILKLKEEIEQKIRSQYEEPKTNEMYVISKYQQMLDGMVEEALMKEILKKI